jgi:integrating conjugative element protein (TIGR03749 family)
MKAITSGHRSAARVALALLVLVQIPFAPSHAEQVVEWRNVPIPIVLTVGEERVLAFPGPVEVGVPGNLTSVAFRTQSTGGTVLWLARQPFDAQRIQVKLLTTGHVMLFDVTAIDAPGAAAPEPVRIVFPNSVIDGGGDTSDGSALTPVTLTRFAAQQLFAPERLLRDLPGVRRVPMGIPKSIALYRHDLISAQPVASWQGGGYTVTAVKLSNRGYSRIFLDPRELRGHFLTATFQHNSVGPKGSISDTTMVYLVSEGAFASAIAEAILPDQADGD